jgi:type IV secretion system protein TrbE
LCHTKTACDLMPLSGVWTGSETAPCPFYPEGSPALLWAITSGAIPFRLNIHVGDVAHTLMFGPNGAGKSTATNVIAMQARRYPGMRITAFDFKGGMMATALACGGVHFDLASEAHGGGTFCPLGVLETASDIEWATDYLSVLYELQTKEEPGPNLRPAIFRAVNDLGNRRSGTGRSLISVVLCKISRRGGHSSFTRSRAPPGCSSMASPISLR